MSRYVHGFMLWTPYLIDFYLFCISLTLGLALILNRDLGTLVCLGILFFVRLCIFILHLFGGISRVSSTKKMTERIHSRNELLLFVVYLILSLGYTGFLITADINTGKPL